MRKYENPTAEFLMFNVEDIITISDADLRESSVLNALDLHAATTWDQSWDSAVSTSGNL